MVPKIHILLTYNCSLSCKHCYVFSDQRAPGKISLSQISRFLNDGRRIPGIEWVYFGGGEPFTQYPLLLKAVQRARKLDFQVGVETNGYFARTEAAGIRLLRPLAAMGVKDLRISNDFLHYQNPETSPANKAIIAAQKLGIPTTLLHVSSPGAIDPVQFAARTAPNIEEPRFMFTGRAAELFTDHFPTIESTSFDSCPRTDLANPERLSVDAYGFVQTCPGIAIGNACQTPLNEIIFNYDIEKHIILRELDQHGPSGLMEATRLETEESYVDACHACYSARKRLLDQYPDLLGPRHVYGY